MDRDWKVWNNVAYTSGLWFPLSSNKIILKLNMCLSATSLLSCQTEWVLICQPYLNMHWISPWGLWMCSPSSWTTGITGQPLLPWEQRFMSWSLSAAQKPEFESRESFQYSWSSHLCCPCSLAQADIPILPCFICREVRQKEPVWVSLALCQPCFGARPLWPVLSSVQPRHSPALQQALRSHWECIHPSPNSSSMDTYMMHMLMHTEHCLSNSPHKATMWPYSHNHKMKKKVIEAFINGEQGSRHFYWKEDFTTGTLL